MKNFNILLLGLSDTAIMTARCFRKYNSIHVYGMDYKEGNNGFYSNLIHSILTPDPNIDENKWLRFVIDWLKQTKTRFILIPVSDEFAYLASKFENKLNDYCDYLIPKIETMDTIIKRNQQFNAAITVGLCVPKFTTVNATYSDISNELKLPIAIKPVNSVEWNKYINKKGFIIQTWEELENILDFVYNKKVEYLAQEIVEGDNNNNYEVNSLFLPDGTLIQHVIRKIRQFPDKFGTATCIEASNNNEVKELASIFIKKLKLYGFSNIEFKYNQQDDKYYYIETNTRVWYQINYSSKLGINFLKIYYDYLTTGNHNKVKIVRDKGKWVDFIPDILFWLRYRKNYKLSFFKFIKSWFPVYSTGLFSILDPKPFIMDLKIIKIIRRRLVKK